MRWAFIVAVAASLLPAVARSGGQDGVARANKMAYEAAMKCFVVDGRLSALRKRAGDSAKSSDYDDSSKAAFDAAVALGMTLGHSKDEIERDFNVVEVREVPELASNEGYLRDSIATCKALGL